MLQAREGCCEITGCAARVGNDISVHISHCRAECHGSGFLGCKESQEGCWEDGDVTATGFGTESELPEVLLLVDRNSHHC